MDIRIAYDDKNLQKDDKQINRNDIIKFLCFIMFVYNMPLEGIILKDAPSRGRGQGKGGYFVNPKPNHRPHPQNPES